MASSPAFGGYCGEGPSNLGSMRWQRFPSIPEVEDFAGSHVTLLDTDVLDCPICYDRYKVNIFQCQNGHTACSSCCVKISWLCAQCREPIAGIRCRALERVVKSARVSCGNARFGCKVDTLYADQFSHQAVCPFSPCSCPQLNCNHIGYYKDLTHHIRDSHNVELIRFALYSDIRISIEHKCDMVMLQEKDDGDVFVVQTFPFANRSVKLAVSRIAPFGPSAGKFLCTVSCAVKPTLVPLLELNLWVNNIQKVTRGAEPKTGYCLIPLFGDSMPLMFRFGPFGCERRR